jgi:predicted ATP-dependent endonuclease of OLD family
MKLIEVTVKKFRNIIDSTPVKIENEITCLVGKNESGKSSFLNSLYRLNPVRNNAIFKLEDHLQVPIRQQRWQQPCTPLWPAAKKTRSMNLTG